MTSQRALIIGASHAGAQLAASLRQEGWSGEVVLIGEESAAPYQRPPLSKSYLAGKSSLDEITIRSSDFYSKQRIQLLDAHVEAILAAARKNKCDLVVMASHGRKGLKRLLLGSETQHVLTHGNIPVLVLR